MIAFILTTQAKAALVLIGVPFLGLAVVAAYITRDVRRHRKNLRALEEAEKARKRAE